MEKKRNAHDDSRTASIDRAKKMEEVFGSDSMPSSYHPADRRGKVEPTPSSAPTSRELQAWSTPPPRAGEGTGPTRQTTRQSSGAAPLVVGPSGFNGTFDRSITRP